jgi:hypothetical protein
LLRFFPTASERCLVYLELRRGAGRGGLWGGCTGTCSTLPLFARACLACSLTLYHRMPSSPSLRVFTNGPFWFYFLDRGVQFCGI